MTLRPEWHRFLVAYLSNGFNAQAAALKAGFSKRDRNAGSRLLKNPAVHAELVRRLTHQDLDIEADGAAIRRGFERIAFDPRTPGKGGPTTTERMSALRNLGQMRGLYINKHLVSGVSLEQLLAGVNDLEEQAGPAEPPVRNPH